MTFLVGDTRTALAAEFTGAHDYLAACTAGLVTVGTRHAMAAELSRRPDLGIYCDSVEACRTHFAQLVCVEPARVAIGSQTSVQASLVAASLPDGAEVLCPEGEFSSLVLPFVHAGRGITVRNAPLADLAGEIRESTGLVAFSLVQSATGEVADADAIVEAARHAGARTLCDATQAVGWMPVDASRYDALICHAYKWLCAPRGVSFLAVSPSFGATLRPVQAGWYAGEDPWASCYGGDAALSTSARRFDVSPAWQAFVGAEPALRAFADADSTSVHTWTTGLATEFRTRLELPEPARPSAIVTWADPDAEALGRLTAAGITASGRNGRARVAFHIFNDEGDVDRAARALGA